MVPSSIIKKTVKKEEIQKQTDFLWKLFENNFDDSNNDLLDKIKLTFLKL